MHSLVSTARSVDPGTPTSFSHLLGSNNCEAPPSFPGSPTNSQQEQEEKQTFRHHTRHLSPTSTMKFPVHIQKRKVMGPIQIAAFGKQVSENSNPRFYGIPRPPVAKSLSFSCRKPVSFESIVTEALTEDSMSESPSLSDGTAESSGDTGTTGDNDGNDAYGASEDDTGPYGPPPPSPAPPCPERKRTIRWSGKIRVLEIRHLKNIPDFEKQAVWMSDLDYRIIKNKAKRTVYRMMAGEFPDLDEDEDGVGTGRDKSNKDTKHDGSENDDASFCTRGLECRTRDGARIRARNKLRTRAAVLAEQEFQREEGVSDPEFLAMASMDESASSREEARRRAEIDAHIARSYQHRQHQHQHQQEQHHRASASPPPAGRAGGATSERGGIPVRVVLF
ncbi:unnamed protein product [Pseudo-nitzschia multistriata]|uniref:Uncharacterized protein n=1 Tax=Pseudo-nitzschia multistriata TaxID=183589 RepID=A0A448YUA3_9STRA|nr:unnamed protein product [Pseudo-nitzschia multistriata]